MIRRDCALLSRLKRHTGSISIWISDGLPSWAPRHSQIGRKYHIPTTSRWNLSLNKSLGGGAQTDMYKITYMTAISLATAFLLALSAFAQNPANTGEIKGVVRDPDQSLVPNCPVTLTNQQTTMKIMAVADG